MLALLSWSNFGVHPSSFDPSFKFVSSPFVSPATLAALRLLVALYALCTICTDLGFNVHYGAGDSFLSYFTVLSYIGLTAYYWAAAVQTFFYARYGSYPLRRWPQALQAGHVVLQSTIVSFPFITTIVFWSLLSSGDTFSTTFSAWSNISIHALNTPFALFDLLFTNVPPAPWLALPIHILFLACYLGVAYITHHTQGFYVYSFLDPQEQGALLAAYVIGIAAGGIILFSLSRGVAVLRQRWASRRGLIPASDEEEGTSEAIDDWEEVGRPADEREERDLEAGKKEGRESPRR
ncbi:hypothetical protein FB45DRAFT_841989 [Roridomyces roridus]|uniref:FAR-17a/AIG1-like protein n=1 Tax=Roridomyces roridus TaxID=1738132 RepID=A0AAD7BBD4_9AGAR|nr:hypothetical protein FB45DRAFT_841989 [Roridomyces roridus]